MHACRSTLEDPTDLSIDVIAPADLSGADEETVTIKVRNDGPSAATNVVVTDLGAANWHVVSADVAMSTGANGEVVFELGDLVSGSTTEFTVAVARGGAGGLTTVEGNDHSSLADAFELDGLFELAFDPLVDDDDTNQHASIVAQGDGTSQFYEFTALTEGYAVIDIDNSDGWPTYLTIYEDGVDVGNGYPYWYSDAGSSGGDDPYVTFWMDEGKTYTVAVGSYDGFVEAPLPEGVFYRLNVSQAGGEFEQGPLVYTASVRSDIYDHDLSDNVDFDQSDTLIPNQTTDLAISIAGSNGALKLGDTLSRTITVTNKSIHNATGVQFYGSTWGIGDISLAPSQGSVTGGTGGDASIDLGDIAAGQSVTIAISGKAISAGDIGGSAMVLADQADTKEADNELTFSTSVAGLTPQKADLELTMTTSRQGLGMQVVNLTLANKGPGLSSGITVLAPQLLGTTTYSASGIQGTYSGATGLWTLGSLRDGISRDMVLTLDAGAPSIGLFRAQIQTSEMADPDSTPGNGKAAEDDQVQSLVALGRLTAHDGHETAETMTGGTADEVFYAKGGDDKAQGGAGHDAFFGGMGNDNLLGQAGNDWFHGGAGNDTLNGGRGTDTVTYVDETRAVTVRLDARTATNVAAGTDKLVSIENAVGGSGKDALTGNASANVLYGLDGNDKLSGGGGKDFLSGGAGKDKLTGGAAADMFVFDTAPRAGRADTITDFRHNLDLIQLEDSIFKAIGPKLEVREFYAAAGATKAHDRNDRIVYDTQSGKLYFDDDGNKSGGHSPILIALLSNKALLDAGDFAII